jgi:hypothetical protein
VNIDLSGSGWTDLLLAIKNAGKYVALDLSACNMTGTEFDPGAANTGESRIVSLVLPDAATSIKAGVSYSPTFKYFTALKEVHAVGVTTTIGDYAFYGCAALTTADFPAATTIGKYAFSNCAALTTADFPTATTIGYKVFLGCTALTAIALPASLTVITNNPFRGCTGLREFTVADGNPNYTHSGDKKMLLSNDGKTLIAYPAASGPVTLDASITAVGNYAFEGCAALIAVNSTAVTSIGDCAFEDCTSLAAADFPAAETIGSYALSNCTSLAAVNLPAAETIGGRAFRNTGTGDLIVTLGTAAPTLGGDMFYGVNSTKAVTVKVPSGAAAWSGQTGTFTGSDSTNKWGNDFRGGGWWNGNFYSGTINSYINLTVTEYTAD